MLNFIYYPISGILWFWHKVFGFVFDESSGISWILAIMFLTFTIRILLVKPTVNQLRSGRKMQELQPQMQAIRAKYKNDQEKMALETRKLYKDAKMNPMASCIAPLVQMPVFFGLFHVLRSFNRTGTGAGQLGMTVEQNRNTPNYLFSATDVQSFLDATVFGVPISAFISMPADMMHAYTTDFARWQVIAVASPLIIIIALFTHFNARLSLNRQKKRREQGKVAAPTGDNAEMMEMQMNMMNKMMLWVLPFTILFTGFLWHIGLLFYMFANNIWTFFQSLIVFRKMDEEEAAEEEAKKAAKRTSAPQVGARKKLTKKQRAEQARQASRDDDASAQEPEPEPEPEPVEVQAPEPEPEPEQPTKPSKTKAQIAREMRKANRRRAREAKAAEEKAAGDDAKPSES